MSYNYNYKFWLVTSHDLKDLLIRQHAVKKLKPSGRMQAHDVFAEIYARYVLLVNKLAYLFNKAFQVQKRALIRRLLEASTRRLLELRNELKKLELSEFIYIDKTLIQKKFIPQDIQLMRPFYFPYIRSDEIEEIINGPRLDDSDEWESYTSEEPVKDEKSTEQTAPEVLDTSTTDDQPKKQADPNPKVNNVEVQEEQAQPEKIRKRRKKPKAEAKKRISNEQQQFINAIKLIQAHERARQARLYLTNIRLHPDKYAPKPPEIENVIKYEFMHKPDQAMLILVKRTRYDANYFVEIKAVKEFDYYAKPKPKKHKYKSTHDDLLEGVSELPKKKDSIEELSIFRNFVKDRSNASNLLVENEPIYAESYFWKGLLREHGVEFGHSVISEDIVQEDTPSILSLKLKRKKFAAARIIQKAWRAYKLRKLAKATYLKRKILYGMFDVRRSKKDINKELKQYQIDVHKRKAWFDQQFIQACEDEKARILKVRGPWIMEDISDHIRDWFREFYYGAGDFDRYPEEFEGGTILLVKGDTMTLPEFKAKKAEKKKSKEEKKKEAEKRKAELAKKREREKKEKLLAKRKEALERKRGGFNMKTMVENKNVEELEKTMREYEIEWENIDERNNLKEEPYMEWIRLEKSEEVYKELRIIVDNLMRIEFELLRKALAKDRKKKYKPQKKKKQKKKKKKGKKKRKKGPKDLTEDRSIASLYYEMEDVGLIRKYQRRNFDDIIGDYNYCAYETRNFLERDTEPSVGEIKDIVREWILGMGPVDLPKARSICIAGPDCSGKNIILEVIATEVDAVMIDLSPEVVIKFEDNIPYLIHLVMKMARILQPTIISIDGIHKVFWKKVPKDQAILKPRLLGKHLFKKIIKPIKKEEKIMFIGLTDAPWQAKQAKMKKCFEKFLLVPRTDYATSFLLWRSIALSLVGFPRDFEFSPIAMVTKNYKTGDICNNIHSTLNVQRRARFPFRPVTHMELLEGFLSRPEPLFPQKDTDFKKFATWFTRVNKLAKQRVKYIKELEVLKAKEKSKAGKKGGK